MGNHRIKINLWIPDIWNPETASRRQKSPILYVLPMACFKIALHSTFRLSPGGFEDGKERITARRQKTHASVLGNTQAAYRQGGVEKVIFSGL